MKARGLTRLRWYCQICSKACRDANGYKCHIESEAHMRQLAARTGEGGQRAGKVIHDYSSQFQHEFVTLLSRRYVDCIKLRSNTQIWHPSRACQYCLPGIHPGSASYTYERNAVGLALRVCQVFGPRGNCESGRK